MSRLYRIGLSALSCALLWAALSTAVRADTPRTGNAVLDAAFEQLLSRDVQIRRRALEDIAQSAHPLRELLLEALLDGSLRLHKTSGRLVLASRQGGGYLVRDVFGGEPITGVGRRELKKFTINNALRRDIRQLLAIAQLQHPEPERRAVAVQQLAAQPDRIDPARLESLLSQETDAAVRDQLRHAIDLALLHAPAADPVQRAAAIERLGDSLSADTGRHLLGYAERSGDAASAAAARAAAERVARSRARYAMVETLLFGISAGSVLVLAAIGLSITFGLMGVINMAHGELIMVGAYTTYVVQRWLPGHDALALLLAIPAAFLVAGAVGVAIERGVIRFLYGRALETLLATFGISLMLQQLARLVFSAQNVPVSNPAFMSGQWQINEALSITSNRAYIALFCLLLCLLLSLVMRRTHLGLEIRAVAQNRAMARAIGIRSARIDALTFAIGSGIAGLAGVALSQLTNVGPNLGQAYIVDSFMVVVFGGVGNLWGTVVGGLGIGIANKVIEPATGAMMAKILILLGLIAFIQWRPRGLFPQRGRAAQG